MIIKALVAALLGLTSVITPVVATSIPQTEEELVGEMKTFDWKETGTHPLPNSHSTLLLPAKHSLLLGKDARRISEILGNGDDKNLEAIAFDEENSAVYFENSDEGYVSLDDWNEIDPVEFLKSIRENTEQANIERKKNGVATSHVIGWLKEPTLDKETNTAYWAIEGFQDDSKENMINSVAIRLGRYGFEKITWVTDRSNYKPVGGELELMLGAHSFDPGNRYTDYTSGDKIASYGIASLVAATVGAKIAKAAGLIVLLKKAGGFIVAIGAAFFFKLKKLFRRKEQTQE